MARAIGINHEVVEGMGAGQLRKSKAALEQIVDKGLARKP